MCWQRAYLYKSVQPKVHKLQPNAWFTQAGPPNKYNISDSNRNRYLLNSNMLRPERNTFFIFLDIDIYAAATVSHA